MIIFSLKYYIILRVYIFCIYSRFKSIPNDYSINDNLIVKCSSATILNIKGYSMLLINHDIIRVCDDKIIKLTR